MNAQEFAKTFLKTTLLSDLDAKQEQRAGWFDMKNGYYVRVFMVKADGGEERFVCTIKTPQKDGRLAGNGKAPSQPDNFDRGVIDTSRRATHSYGSLVKLLTEVKARPKTKFADVTPETEDMAFAKKVIAIDKVFPERGGVEGGCNIKSSQELNV